MNYNVWDDKKHLKRRTAMNPTLSMYKAAGNDDFTKMVTEFAPYFQTIDPVFVDLKPGYAELTFDNQKKFTTTWAPSTPSPCATRRSWWPE